jgi:hypothetical protein
MKKGQTLLQNSKAGLQPQQAVWCSELCIL